MNVEGNLQNREGALASGLLPDGREWVIYPQIFTAKIGIGMPEVGWLDDVWCYETAPAAIAGIVRWDGDGEPDGWHRHPATGRRRPHGDATKEYVAR